MTTQQFIGVKLIRAKPMTRAEYNTYRGWALPADEDGSDAGYLVEYLDGGKANTPDHAGYVSWSPEDVFQRAYRECTGMTFGLAVEALKAGQRVARAGWNGKGMWITYSPGSVVPAERFWAQRNKEYAEQTGGCASVLPCLTMKTATGEILMGWLASQSDMLSDDWEIVGPQITRRLY